MLNKPMPFDGTHTPVTPHSESTEFSFEFEDATPQDTRKALIYFSAILMDTLKQGMFLDPKLIPVFYICGLAGSGKSFLNEAMMRAISDDLELSDMLSPLNTLHFLETRPRHATLEYLFHDTHMKGTDQKIRLAFDRRSPRGKDTTQSFFYSDKDLIDQGEYVKDTKHSQTLVAGGAIFGDELDLFYAATNTSKVHRYKDEHASYSPILIKLEGNMRDTFRKVTVKVLEQTDFVAHRDLHQETKELARKMHALSDNIAQMNGHLDGKRAETLYRKSYLAPV